ncbi:MAG: 4Fe-4S dicluster domain-containing protein [Pseudomonadota bacterium]
MQIDANALANNLGYRSELPLHTQLCRRQIAQFETELEGDAPLLIACTQEAPLFQELADERDRDGLKFVNIRERAAWGKQGADSLPKMAALIAEAGYTTTPTGLMTIKSDGQCLVYGAGQQTLEIAEQLADRLSVTVVFTDASDVVPPTTVSVPLHIGRIRQLKGTLGAFEVSIDGFAPVVPSARQKMGFEMPRDGFSTTCDLVLDLSGGAPMFPDTVTRDGYFRVDPSQPAAVAKAVFEISDMVGEFEKPLYVNYDADICAHGRSTKVGCQNCLDNCPTGAIVPNGDNIKIDPSICGGCGNCSAVCPTGAVSYAYPARHDVIRRLQILAATYRGAGGTNPVLLIHDESHGSGIISMMARYSRGLPANVVPLALYSVFQTGHETMTAALTAGFTRIVVLAPPDKPHDLPALENQVELTNAFLGQLGWGNDRVTILNERDPDLIEAHLHDAAEVEPIVNKTVATLGGKRDIARLSLAALNDAASEPKDIIALSAGAPYGRLDIDADGCTLCLACVGSCPAGALSDDEERPRLSFNESACVQCGLCVATCPEGVIKLDPRYNFKASVLEPITVKEEEPFECISCGRPFGTKSTVERIVAKLEGNHAMFRNKAQIDVIKMCDDCRVIAVSNAGGDPMAMGERPRVRTTEDYLIGSVDDDEC